MTTSAGSARFLAFRRRHLAVFALVAVVIVGLTAARLVVKHPGSSVSGPATTTAAATVGRIAPIGPFTTTTNQTVSLASYLGRHPAMVWFVVAGCASCAVSIPAVAQHLRQLARDHVHVVVLDLYGDLGSGRAGTANLTEFGKAAAGSGYASKTWTWGLASKSLSYAYDSSRTPDEYFLVASNGRVVYENSVPVSTMPQLLSKAKALR